MATQEDPSVLLNGVAYGFNSCRFTILSSDLYFKGSSELSFEEKRTRAKQWGAQRSGIPLSRTSGKYEPGDVKWKLPVKFVNSLKAALASYAKDSVSYGNVVFNGLLQFIEPTDETPHSIAFFDLAISAIASSFTEGPDGLMQEVTFDCMYIMTDGLSLADRSLDTP